MDLHASRAGKPVLDVGQVQHAVAVIIRDTPDAVRLLGERAATAEDAGLVSRGGGGDVDLPCSPLLGTTAARYVEPSASSRVVDRWRR